MPFCAFRGHSIGVLKVPMRFRKLRIAFSALCGMACLLLIVLWLRSYRVADDVQMSASHLLTIRWQTFRGQLIWWEIGALETAPRTWNHHAFWNTAERQPDWEQMDVLVPSWHWVTMGTGAIAAFVIPCWFPTLVSVALATAPWLRWRFSLRTLLIATTLLAVVLGLAIYAARK